MPPSATRNWASSTISRCLSSISRRSVRATSIGCFPDLPHVHELDFKDHRRIRRDAGRRSLRSVRESSRDRELAPTAFFHAGNASFPPRNHLRRPEHELVGPSGGSRRVERLPAVAGGGTVVQPAGVMHHEAASLLGGFPAPLLNLAYLNRLDRGPCPFGLLGCVLRLRRAAAGDGHADDHRERDQPGGTAPSGGEGRVHSPQERSGKKT